MSFTFHAHRRRQLFRKPMRPAKRYAFLTLIALLLTSGCQTKEQTGGVLGAGGGALLGGILGEAIGHSGTGALLGASVGALGGYFVGTAVGRQLDEADRKRAAEATHKALAQPVFFSADPAVPPRLPNQSAQWKSDHSGASGTAKVVAAQRTTDGGECRTVREVAYIKGQEVPQTSRYCRGPEGDWVAQS